MKIWIDGSGWNGRRCGWLFCTESGDVKSRFYETPYTNNEMEYAAMSNALESAKEGDEILSDSALVVNQISGRWKVKEPRLFSHCSTCRAIVDRKRIKLTWIPREENRAGHLIERV
jgi:ribonuclease HI